MELAGAGHHPEGENVSPSAPQPGGFDGHLRCDGGCSGHAPKPCPRAERQTVETGAGPVPGVDLIRRALLYSQHLERDGHCAGPLLVHHQAPAVHTQDTQKDLQCDDSAHLATVLYHLLVTALRLGRDLLRGDEVPGEPGAFLHHFLHLWGVLPPALCGSLCLLEDLQGCQISDWLPQVQHNHTHG